MQDKRKFEPAAAEEKILKFWEENKIFEKSLRKNAKKKPFVFYEGPPTANGLPHVGHALSRAYKDAVLRYKTMRGFFVPRRAGWDTHGLPVELGVEKELGLKTKSEIEKYGIAGFNRKAKESVWKYKEEWDKLTIKLGFWLDLSNPYITYKAPYMETLWRIIKEVWKKGLLYEDFKIVPWCPRCETALSSHELALGYKKIKEDSVFVKLKLKGRKNEFLLVWTTTPWTLPANVAVAVNPSLEYVKFRTGEEYVWSAAAPSCWEGKAVSVAEKISGKSMLGWEYEPLFSVPSQYSLGRKPFYKTIAADFVSAENGTGMVHIAPAFGEDDMEAVKSHARDSFSAPSDSKIYYPVLSTVEANGIMKKGITGAGLFVKEADGLVISDLKKRGLVCAVKPYEHDYPFCWRCETPLIYFARNGWWIKMSVLKDDLLRFNKGINWIPAHLKEGRFGEFLRELRDWAFSRERYWGTPLPMWKCGKCLAAEVVGSRAELAKLSGSSGNRYFLLRHGEAFSNARSVVSCDAGNWNRLTVRGRAQTKKTAEKIKKAEIDLIFSSDLTRTRETAEIAARVLGIKKINFDKRLREINAGIFDGRATKEYHSFFSGISEKFVKNPPGGENLSQVRKRVLEFARDMEKKHSGKNILIVSHEYPIWMLYGGMNGLSDEETAALRVGGRKDDFLKPAEFVETEYQRLPRNEEGETDLHRPYVDGFEIICRFCGAPMKRTPEVADVWFDSGAMPFAQFHWPFGKEKIPFPADFICEGVDQTRGWFYTLLAVSALLDKGAPYKNVVSLGHILDKDGRKMSKSRGNVVDPAEMMKKYGSDALRWYFYAVSAAGEPKKFNENDLLGKLKGFLLTFWNSFVFFDTYTAKKIRFDSEPKPKSFLDKWVILKLEALVAGATVRLDRYDLTGAAREIENFAVNDFSQWYLRRSRVRFQKPRTKEEKEEAAKTAGRALLTLCRISAPFIPFLSEKIYGELRRKLGLKEESVHLANWPAAELRVKREKIAEILSDMELARKIAGEALRLRAEAGIKVRQPLAKLQIAEGKLRKNRELLSLLKDEVNVKKIIFGEKLELDAVITPALKNDGIIREIIRNVQEMRRDLGLKPRNVVKLQFHGASGIEKLISGRASEIKKDTNADAIKIGGKKTFKAERELDFEGEILWTGVEV